MENLEDLKELNSRNRQQLEILEDIKRLDDIDRAFLMGELKFLLQSPKYAKKHGQIIPFSQGKTRPLARAKTGL